MIINTADIAGAYLNAEMKDSDEVSMRFNITVSKYLCELSDVYREYLSLVQEEISLWN